MHVFMIEKQELLTALNDRNVDFYKCLIVALLIDITFSVCVDCMYSVCNYFDQDV